MSVGITLMGGEGVGVLGYMQLVSIKEGRIMVWGFVSNSK